MVIDRNLAVISAGSAFTDLPEATKAMPIDTTSSLSRLTVRLNLFCRAAVRPAAACDSKELPCAVAEIEKRTINKEKYNGLI